MPSSAQVDHRPPSIIMGSFCWESALGRATRGIGTTTVAGIAYGTANLAIYVPLVLTDPVTAVKLWVDNGGTVNGNVDVGIYDNAGTRLVSAGSTANAGASDLQEFDITDTLIPAGRIYIAMASSSTTAAFRSAAVTAPKAQLCGVYVQTTAFPLPATATFAIASTLTFVPGFGFSRRVLTK